LQGRGSQKNKAGHENTPKTTKKPKANSPKVTKRQEREYTGKLIIFPQLPYTWVMNIPRIYL